MTCYSVGAMTNPPTSSKKVRPLLYLPSLAPRPPRPPLKKQKQARLLLVKTHRRVHEVEVVVHVDLAGRAQLGNLKSEDKKNEQTSAAKLKKIRESKKKLRNATYFIKDD